MVFISQKLTKSLHLLCLCSVVLKDWRKSIRFCHLEQKLWRSCGPPPVCQPCLTGQSYQLLPRHPIGAFRRQVPCGHVLLSVWNLLTHLAWCPQVPRVPAKEQIRSDVQLFTWNLIDRDKENKERNHPVQYSSDIMIVLNGWKLVLCEHPDMSYNHICIYE